LGLIHTQNADAANQTPVPTSNAVSVTLTRTADTNAYTANDVVGAATGSTAALSFASLGPPGANIMVTGCRLRIDVAAVPSGMTSFDLHLYDATPPSALGDNAAFDLPSGTVGTTSARSRSARRSISDRRFS
jgi:hypothetical protein